ncbi:DUF2213 domain-containing protein [Citrobacter portucalensis]|uniref:DUF2213 domain-containing protein n=1 Tax=Citrobacter portucalensis TaxID=1639133 RepID=UPI00242E21E9|nr:DUF2213 domain-containing protein [Citrobacter portucalensis]WFZ22210.1 DUF2213 domain-containing protein [Citrobacter portucalensis]
MKFQHDTEINVDAVKDWTVTDEGWLQIDIPVRRAGVLTYDKSKGDAFTAKEYLSEDELFNADSMKTLIGKPVAMTPHPKGGRVTAKNYRALNVGTVIDAFRRGDDLIARSLIQDENAIKLILNDKSLRGASAGYQCDEKLKVTGSSKWGDYDTVQRGAKYNHIIICRNPRNSNARFNLDEIMTKEVNVDELQEQVTTLTKERDGLQKQVGTLNGELLAANKKIVNLDSQNSEAYERGVKDGKNQHLLNEHAKALGINVDSLDPKLVKIAVIKKASPQINTDSWDDAQIDTALEMAMTIKPAKEFTQNPRRPTVNNDESGDGKSDSHADYQKRMFGGN